MEWPTMPIEPLTSSRVRPPSTDPESPAHSEAPVNRTLPLEGFIRSAAIRSSLLFPAPFGPSRTTNSPERMSSETLRKATSDPNRFSTLSKDIPKGSWPEGMLVPPADKGERLAFHQLAHDSLHAGVFMGVFFFADRAGLPTQLEA